MKVGLKLKTIKGSVDVFNKGIAGYLRLIAVPKGVYINKKNDTILYYFGELGDFKLKMLYNVASIYTKQYQAVMKNKTFNKVTRKWIKLTPADKKLIEDSLKNQMDLQVIESEKDIDLRNWRRLTSNKI